MLSITLNHSFFIVLLFFILSLFILSSEIRSIILTIESDSTHYFLIRLLGRIVLGASTPKWKPKEVDYSFHNTTFSTSTIIYSYNFYYLLIFLFFFSLLSFLKKKKNQLRKWNPSFPIPVHCACRVSLPSSNPLNHLTFTVPFSVILRIFCSFVCDEEETVHDWGV